MKRKTVKRVGKFLGVFLAIATVVSCLGVRRQIQFHSGALTELVDAERFNTKLGALALVNVRVLSADCESLSDPQTVLIQDGLFVAIGPQEEVPGDFQVIDGSGKFLIPGLIDAHTHLHRSKNDLLLYLANGVTSIANMNSLPEGTYLDWKREAEEGALSPRLYIAAGGMSTSKGLYPWIQTFFGSRRYNSPEKARRAVRKFKDQGYDAIKSYAPSKEVYYAIMDEAKVQNIPVTGHVPYAVGIEGLYTSGQSGVAHVEELSKNSFVDFGGFREVFYDNIEAYMAFVSGRADSIAIRLKEADITVCSTSGYYSGILKQDLDLKRYLKEIELEYANPGVVEGSRYRRGWLPGENKFEDTSNTDQEGRERAQLYWGTYIKSIDVITQALDRNGVKLVTGSDSNGYCTVPGFSFHEQLWSLDRIGFAPAKIYRMATVNASEWMGHNTGVIQVGKMADAVLLNANPLEDVRNAKKIEAVFIQGKYLNRKRLDEMLKAVKDANNRSRNVNIDEFLRP